MVFHDQSDDIARQIKDFNCRICDLGLDPEAFVFHAGPLIRREKGYEFLSRHHRGKIYNRMMTFARRINSLAGQALSGVMRLSSLPLMY